MRADRQEQELKFTRRALLLSAGGALAFLGLGARLYSVQVLETERYSLLSDDNQFNFALVPPSRGQILDRFGIALAENRDNFRVLMMPDRQGGLDSALDDLSRFMPVTEAQRARARRNARRARANDAVVIANDLDWSAFATINLHAAEMPGIRPDVGEVRSYPYAGAFAHVIGYVQTPNTEDVANESRSDRDLLLSPGFRIGKTGIEVSREQDLRGTAGALKQEVDASNRVIREIPEQSVPPQSGRDIVLTLDTDIQRFAHERLGEESAAAIVIDVNTGELIALASTPSFDPNLFVGGISTADYQALQQNDHNPLYHKCVQGTYPPGSTFKSIVAAAALEDGLIDPDERIDCTGSVRLGDRDFHCWRPRGHGPVNMHEAMKTSCDVYFYEVAQRVGITRMEQLARHFGLGEEFRIGIAGIADGNVPSPQWLRARHNLPWTMGHTYNTGIGQGYLTASPLQLAVKTARIASGRLVTPSLFRNAMAAPPPRIEISDETMDIVRWGMHGVVHEPDGTSFALGGLGIEGVDMAGKTGTAQVYSISREEREQGVREQEDLPWRLRDHGLFVCYAPYDNPKYACVVVVEHGGGSTAAKFPARDILARVVARDPSSRPGVFADLGPSSGGRG